MGYFTLFFLTKCSKSRAYFTLSTHHTSIQPSFISRTQQLHVLVAIILDNAGQYQDIPHEKVSFAFLSGEQYNQSHLIPVASCGSRPASVNQLVKKKVGPCLYFFHVSISFSSSVRFAQCRGNTIDGRLCDLFSKIQQEGVQKPPLTL